MGYESDWGKTVKIAIIVEGSTEKAFKNILQTFLEQRLQQNMPKLKFITSGKGGRIPKKDDLRRDVERLLQDYEAVIALTDVYTGSNDFINAEDAKQKMRQWVGNQSSFYPHAAQYEFEAWLLPFWDTIQKIAKHNQAAPSSKPETVNHNNPPSRRIQDIFERGRCRDSYSKVRDAKRILQKQNLIHAARVCPELRDFLNTILDLCGGTTIM